MLICEQSATMDQNEDNKKIQIIRTLIYKAGRCQNSNKTFCNEFQLKHDIINFNLTQKKNKYKNRRRQTASEK